MGIKTGIVTGQSIEAYRGGDEVRILQVQLLGQNPETVEWFDITGEDTAPVNGDKVVVWNIADNYQIAVATKDLVVAAVNAGERKFYSRDSDGNVKSTIYLKDIGTIQIDTDLDLIANVGGDTTINSVGNITSTAPKWIHNGDFEVNGNTVMDGTLTVSGIIKSLVDIIADYAGTAITLLTHFAQGNLGFPTGTPIQSGGGTTPSPLPSADTDGDLITGGGVSLDDHDHNYTWTDPAGSGTTDPPN